jgi:hypothetical protein
MVIGQDGRGSPRSTWLPHSYDNIYIIQEHYESVEVSSQMDAQTRSISILIHKDYFVYEWLCTRHTGPPEGCRPYGQQRRGESGVTPARSGHGPPMVESRSSLSAPCVLMARLHTGDYRCMPHPWTDDDGAVGTGGDAA